MFVLSPCDNQVCDSKSDIKDGNFGGQRQHISEDGVENVVNPDDTTKDIDDLDDDKAKKRKSSRRAETSTVGGVNQYRRPGDANDKIYSYSDNLPKSGGCENDVVVSPDNKKHGPRNPWRIGG